MSDKIRFENHYALRVMEILFPEGFVVGDAASLRELKTAWTHNLKHWHSPYTCLFDARDFKVAPEFAGEFASLIKFFQNFFMRKIVGFSVSDEAREEAQSQVPFPVLGSYETAVTQTGLSREALGGPKRDLGDLRSRIQIDNDFNAHVMEISFLAETTLASPQDVEVLRSKVQNILMQWHSPYSVLFNCQQLAFTPEGKEAFGRFERFVRGFFCKDLLGYSPRAAKETYPFRTFRSRHLAAGELEHSGLQSGADANCSTRRGAAKV